MTLDFLKKGGLTQAKCGLEPLLKPRFPFRKRPEIALNLPSFRLLTQNGTCKYDIGTKRALARVLLTRNGLIAPPSRAVVGGTKPEGPEKYE